MQLPIDIVIRGKNESIAATRDYITRRLSFALHRFEHRIRRVKVLLIDLNGPRGGIDSRCSMTVEFLQGGNIVVEATTAMPFSAVTRAASRLKEAVRRGLDRTTSGHAAGVKRAHPWVWKEPHTS